MRVGVRRRHAYRLTPMCCLRRAALPLICCAAWVLAACAAPPPTATPVSEAEPGSAQYDRDVFETLLGNHELIRRDVQRLPDGIEATTESDNPEVAALIRNHVHAMKVRLEKDARIRQWDPIFVAIFDNAGRIRMEIVETPKGVRVRETSDDPWVARLIQTHAVMVSGFVARGSEESLLEHQPPAK